jgi:hypothetical protein
MGKRVFIEARDLFFRSKLTTAVQYEGAEVTRDDAECDLAVIELGGPAAEARIRSFAGRGIPVLAFGSHMVPDALRAAREAGAEAVPNSQAELKLRELLA